MGKKPRKDSPAAAGSANPGTAERAGARWGRIAVLGPRAMQGVLAIVPKSDSLAGDFWGGLAAMLVAVPSAIAFGVTVFAPLGGTYAAYGAIAGILGTIALGLVAPAAGGTNRLVTAPCAPAAAVLSAFAIQLTQQGTPPQGALILLALTGLICGLLQVSFGSLRLGQLIKYMPYPVVSGYLSGVGLVIIVSQVPLWLGAAKETGLFEVLGAPATWDWKSITVGAVTMIVMLAAPRVTKAVPAAILGLLAGMIAYFALGLVDPALYRIEGNPMIVGPVGGSGGFLKTFADRLTGLESIGLADLAKLAMPAATLAVLLSIDTLKTCVVLDALTRSRHNSNRELVAQGLGNLTSTLIGGMPGAGQMGATLVNMSSGGRTRLSGNIEGILALAAFLVFGNLVAWVPIASLAGILIIVGFRMFDWKSLQFLKSRSTILDFAVIVVVIVVAKTVSLIAASGTGIVLAVLLFIREQISASVVHRKSLGNRRFSKQVRLTDEMRILQEQGRRTVVFELQGSLFFGTADQLYRAIAPEFDLRSFVILDMRRVQSVDVTAVHVLEQIEDALEERGAVLAFSNLPRLPSGREMEDYFGQVGLVKPGHQSRVFGELENALEWAEDQILADNDIEKTKEKRLDLRDMDIFRKRRDKTIAKLEACMEARSVKAGERLFALGDIGDELYLIRRGSVRIVQPLKRKPGHHLATFNRGDFFGEMAFLDREPRSADAVAETDCELFVLSRAAFDTFATNHRKVAMGLFTGLARTLSLRLRHTTAELRQFEDA